MARYLVRSQVKNKKRSRNSKASTYKSWVLGVFACLFLMGGFFALVFLFRSQGAEVLSGLSDESALAATSPDLLRPSLATLETVKEEDTDKEETELPVFKGVIRQFWEDGHFYYKGQVQVPILPESGVFGLWLLRKQPFEYRFAGFVKRDEDGFWRADGKVRFATQPFEQVLLTEVNAEDVESGKAEHPGHVFAEGSFVFEDVAEPSLEEGL